MLNGDNMPKKMTDEQINKRVDFLSRGLNKRVVIFSPLRKFEGKLIEIDKKTQTAILKSKEGIVYVSFSHIYDIFIGYDIEDKEKK
jgi:hypothetical protein